MQNNDESVVTIIFQSAWMKQGYGPGLLTDDSFTLKIENSVIELILAVREDFIRPKSEEGESLPSFLFDICLEKLNLIIKSYLVTTKDVSIHQVTTRMFEVSSMFKITETENWNSEVGLLMLHQDIPYQKPILKEEEYQEVIWYANVINQDWNPFIFPEELMLNSRRNLIKGFFREAVIFSQTSFETFVRTLIFEIYKADNLQINELEKKFETRGFMSVLKSEFHQRIGGNWGVYKLSDPLSGWYYKCYRIRNRIVHSGYSPDFSECEEAIDAAEFARNYILKIVEGKKVKYPKIFDYIKMK
jgi:hypothetical protein